MQVASNPDDKGFSNDAQSIYESIQPLNSVFAVERQIGWDLSAGVKSQSDVKLLLDTFSRVKKSSRLQKIIQLIGKQCTHHLNASEDEGLNFFEDAGKSNSSHFPDDYSVNSISGITLGDDITRMLPSELSMLAHPTLKLLWHAKRADRLLKNYHIQGVLSQHVPNIANESITEDAGRVKLKQQGPMILCLDTSASMKGRAEYQAKAVVFETMRVARLENRDCYLYNFGSTDELLEIKLDLHESGWQPIIDFLKQSFHGGTDINAVVNLALAKVQEKDWNNADILIVSDGRFHISEEIVELNNTLTYKPTIYGLQVSHWNTSGFNKICHQTFSIPYDRR